MDNKPKYDSSCEYGCFSERLYKIPGGYNVIDIGTGFLVPIEFPNAYDGRFFIMIYTFKDYDVKEYRISLYEPKYIYDSDKLPDNIRDIVIDSIIRNYRKGIEAINKECDRIVIDPNIDIPDYNKL